VKERGVGSRILNIRKGGEKKSNTLNHVSSIRTKEESKVVIIIKRYSQKEVIRKQKQTPAMSVYRGYSAFEKIDKGKKEKERHFNK